MGRRAVAPHIDESQRAIEAHHARHGTIPSMAGLARLWGYASKSSAARRVGELVEAGVLAWSPDRRLRPGPAFRVAGDTHPVPAAQEPELDEAMERWSTGYDRELTRAYMMTVRLLRLARSIEAGLARTAASEGLSAGEVLVLDTLFRAGPPHALAPTALKRHFVISLAGVAKRLERLLALGLIERVPNPDDRRGMLVQLTASGVALLRRLVELDRHSPHIMWPMDLSERDYRVMMDGLQTAQALIDADERDN
ncbi:MarR family winged helix-turn-helix transcriptional regulator [Rhizorhabdus dicambivorans]|uniref:MarR family transcriptional regulator n=1 Tax=Rhizorhabdus dicambivorans TaxID=1850238 RepID=A0A2A4FPS5_9SPHN|nr:MarR family transcriptional regulator [Rhizorhabdus dicambivorans]ATE63977.1 MarR family transcriptional regulator [Rhizorhabdus dicambivorans]PCE40177.1 MarR family transcriptional regulator [Rhizorhabdus dicambivorans]